MPDVSHFAEDAGPPADQLGGVDDVDGDGVNDGGQHGSLGLDAASAETDGGVIDAATVDAGTTDVDEDIQGDVGVWDAGTPDAGAADAGAQDIASVDIDEADLGASDADAADAAGPDVSPDTAQDAGVDAGPDVPADVPPDVAPDVGFTPLAPGDLLITEMMINPDAVADSVGEWIELHNPGSKAIDINGLELTVGSSVELIGTGAPLWVPPKGYLVIGVNASAQVNGGVAVAWAWKKAALSNKGTSVVIREGKVIVDGLTYASGAKGWPGLGPGASLQLDPGSMDPYANDLGSAWCKAGSAFGKGDLGTPGKANPPCGASSGTCGNKVKEPGEQCDDGNAKAGDGCGPTCQLEMTGKAKPGDVVISEIMVKTVSSSKDKGEWFEIHNPNVSKTVDIGGLVVTDKAKHMIVVPSTAGPVKIPPKGYFVFAHPGASNGGIAADFGMGDLQLGNSSGLLRLTINGVELDKLSYSSTSGWPFASAGHSWQLMAQSSHPKLNDAPSQWCVSKQKYGGGPFYGTPGKSTDCGGP